LYRKLCYDKDERKSTLSKSYFFGDVRPQFVDQDGVLVGHMSFHEKTVICGPEVMTIFSFQADDHQNSILTLVAKKQSVSLIWSFGLIFKTFLFRANSSISLDSQNFEFGGNFKDYSVTIHFAVVWV